MTTPAATTPVLVTGGTGTLGRAVVAELGDRGVPARVLSRHAPLGAAGPGEAAHAVVRGDLGTGAGLDAAVSGVSAVIHCASDPRHARDVDVEGTGRLLASLQRVAPQAHLVDISIVGCDANPLGYYRRKHEAELLIGRSTVPASIVRATQFHDLVARLCRAVTLGRVAASVRGLAVQPCDTAFVAAHLVRVALGAPLPDRLELAGPDRLDLPEAIWLTAEAAGRPRPRVVSLPGWGRAGRAFAAGSNLPGAGALTGGRSYAAWLAHRA